jgi:surfactin synthase thioesterase subunit
MRLYCFPFAGGAAALFHGWKTELPGIDVRAMELPGRGTRRGDPLVRRVGPLVEAAVARITADGDGPFALFGHSFGGMIAFETARALVRGEHRTPRAVFLSALSAAHLPKARRPIWNLPDAEFVAEIRRYGGTPEEVLADPDLAALFLTAVRADFEAFDTYRYEPGPLPGCPVVVFGGTDDDRVGPVQLQAWHDILPDVRVHMLPGDHFYVRTARRPLTQAIGQSLGVS